MNSKFPFKSFVRTVKTFKPHVDPSTLPEYVYAGKNLKTHKRIYMSGVIEHGALGDKKLFMTNFGTCFKYMSRPYRLEFADVFKVDGVSCGYGFTIFSFREKDGSPAFYGTGIASDGQLGRQMSVKNNKMPYRLIIQPSKIKTPLFKQFNHKKVACGRAHSLFWTDTDGLWTVGTNNYGQCSRPIKENEELQQKSTFHHIPLFNGKDVQQLECGQDTSFVLCDGVVYSCGWNADGQSGTGGYDSVTYFRPVEGDLKGEKVVKISSKGDCCLALTEKGELFGWGNSEYRQLVSADSDAEQMATPYHLQLDLGGEKIVDVGTTGSSCFAVTENGDVWCWGFNVLGLGPEVTFAIKPKLMPSTLLGRNALNKDSKVVKIFTGLSSAVALTNYGGLYMWGKNTGGCLGLGHIHMQQFPLRICMASVGLEVSCGIDHTAVLARSLV